MQGVKIILFKIFMLDIFAQFFLRKMEHVSIEKRNKEELFEITKISLKSSIQMFLDFKNWI